MHSAPLHILNRKNLRMIDKLKSCCGALRIILEGEIIFWSAEFGKATLFGFCLQCERVYSTFIPRLNGSAAITVVYRQ